jgi:P4 family phage/plasmid primase-like protien
LNKNSEQQATTNTNSQFRPAQERPGGKIATPELRTALEQRGILQPALDAGVTEHIYRNQHGWAIPLVDETGQQYSLPDGRPAQRWKNCDSNADPKCTWGYADSKSGESKPDGCDIYFPPQVDIQVAIAAIKHTVIIACGEPDAWTFIAADMPNVISFFGESNIPADLVNRLKALNVQKVLYYPDRDQTGGKAAEKLANVLNGSGIALHIGNLPKQVGKKPVKDINDYFCALGCDPDLFRQRLSGLEFSQFAKAPIKPKESLKPTAATPKSSYELPEGYYAAIEQALGVQGYKSNDWSKPVRCPFGDHENDDKCPTGGWHQDMHIFRCFKCDQPYLAIEVGEALGIDWHDYIERPAHPTPNRFNGKGPGKTNAAPVSTNQGGDENQQQPTDDEVGDILIDLWDGNIAFFREGWHRYANGVWQPEDNITGDIWDTMIILKSQKVRPSNGKAHSIEEYLKTKQYVPNAQIDQGDNYINLQNGMYNLATGRLEPHQRELYHTSQLGFAYDASADCPTWEHFLEKTLVTPTGETDWQLIQLLQEAVGYSLTTDTRLETSFWLCGPAGSGKSTTIKVLAGLLGSAFISLNLNALDKNHYQLADIPGKRVVACTEAKAGGRLADEVLKPLISGEEMVVRQPYKQTYRFQPQAKVWWAMNERPVNLDRSNAIYRRLQIIPFNHAIPRDQQDRHLFDKLLTELPGIFNWALKGLRRLRQNGDFTQADQVEATLAEYKDENDTEEAFLNDAEWCLLDEQSQTQASDLYLAYKAWCKRFGHSNKSRTRVARDWERLGLTKMKNGHVFYSGVALKQEATYAVNREKTSTNR